MRITYLPYDVSQEAVRILFHVYRFLNGIYTKHSYTTHKNLVDVVKNVPYAMNQVMLFPKSTKLAPDTRKLLKGINRKKTSVLDFVKYAESTGDLCDTKECEQIFADVGFYKPGEEDLKILGLEKFRFVYEEIVVYPTVSGNVFSYCWDKNRLHIWVNIFVVELIAASKKESPKSILKEVVIYATLHAHLNKNLFYRIEPLSQINEIFLYFQIQIFFNAVKNLGFAEIVPTIIEFEQKSFRDKKWQSFQDDFLEILPKTVPEKKFELSEGEIIFDSQDIGDTFTKKERRLMTILIENSGKLVEYTDISDAIWGQDTVKKFSLWAIQKIVENLRRRLMLLKIDPTRVENVRGRGYRLR